MNYHLINAILRAPWLIDREWVNNRGAVIFSILNGGRVNDYSYNDDDNREPVAFDPAKHKNKSYVINMKNITAGRWTSLSDPEIPEGSTAVIPIRTEIMKYNAACGGARGTLSIEQDIKAADQNPNISGMVLVIDSPGGEVTHTDILANTIANSKTPVVAFVEGMAASAAYWLASAADIIIASSEMDRVGSIGTMVYFADMTPYWEAQGVKFHEFYATKSTEKNKEFQEIQDGKYDNYRINVLDRLNERFHDFVKSNRPNLDEKVLKGASYFAVDGMKLGLVDEIGSFDYAVSVAGNMQSKNNIENQKESEHMKINKAWNSILSFFSIGSDKAEETDLTPEMVEQMNTELTERASKIADLESKVIGLEGKVSQTESELATEKDAHASTVKSFEDFKKQDAAGETTTAKSKDEIEQAEDKFDHLAHNKAVDDLL